MKKNVVIEFMTSSYPNGITSSVYNSMSSTVKTQYTNYLRGLSNVSTYGNARWNLSYEMFVPANIAVTIPANVCIVANGGLFSGTGILKGERTKIEAGFEQIFDENLMFQGSWDVNISHPEWFGYSDFNIDATKKIQKAIDLINVEYSDNYTDSKYSGQNYSISGFFLHSGKIVCKPGSKYLITSTIYLKSGHSFDGGRSNFIYGINTSIDEQRYMFKLNVNSAGDPIIQERTPLDQISNIKITNPKLINNAYGFYCGSQVCTFENIYTEFMFQTFRRHGSYLDQLTLSNFVVAFPRKSPSTEQGNALYQIDMGYVGDNLLLNNIHTFVGNTGSNGNEQLIRINCCGGGKIQNVINGSILILNSKSIEMSGIHQEYGNITLTNSQVDINGWNHHKKPNVPALMTSANGYQQRTSTIRNVMIAYDHKVYYTGNNPYSNEEDFKLNGVSTLQIENVTRHAKQANAEVSSLYGVNINHYSYMLNSANHSLRSIISGAGLNQANEQTVINDFISYSVKNNSLIEGIYVSNNSSSVTGSSFGPAGSYTYYASLVFDISRNIGINKEELKPSAVTITNSTKHVTIQFRRTDYSGLTIRLYRKRANDSTIYYIDIPCVTTYNTYYDLGQYALFGETWKVASNATSVQTCSKYKKVGDNVIVEMNSAPSNKTGWMNGDIIMNTDSATTPAFWILKNGNWVQK